MREGERERERKSKGISTKTRRKRDQSIEGMPIVWARKERDLRDDGADSGEGEGEGGQQMDKMKAISGEED